MSASSPLVFVLPYHYIHVLNKNTQIDRLITGPITFIPQANEIVNFGPEAMVTVSQDEYVIIENPVKRNEDGHIIFDDNGRALISFKEIEYRYSQPPFPLYPGEVVTTHSKMAIINPNEGLLLSANVDFISEDNIHRIALQKWVQSGPGFYKPCKEVSALTSLTSTIKMPNLVYTVVANEDFIDDDGIHRHFGDEWILNKTGRYFYEPNMLLLRTVYINFLNKQNAIHVHNVKDSKEKLITHLERTEYSPGVGDIVSQRVHPHFLRPQKYLIISNPVGEDGYLRLGHQLLVEGPKNFFLKPGESILKTEDKVCLLTDSHYLILKALTSFNDNGKDRLPGEEWMIRGPLEYVPPLEVVIVSNASAIPLDVNEGVYVRDNLTGKIRSVVGRPYILGIHEKLETKWLSKSLVKILYPEISLAGNISTDESGDFLISNVVQYPVPYNAAVQVYNSTNKTSCVVLGPNLICLDYHEEFTMLSLSGDQPKRPNVHKTVALRLGPEYCSDVVLVQTVDNTHICIQLAYKWHFEVSPQSSQSELARIFSVPDFIGDFCRCLSSQIRGSVASKQFSEFHKEYFAIISRAVFGEDEEGKTASRLVFPLNKLVITSVDVHAIDPVDGKIRASLQNSVKLAIEIMSQSNEAVARHEAELRNQEVFGRLQKLQIENQVVIEEARSRLIALQLKSVNLETVGKAKLLANSLTLTELIHRKADVLRATLLSEAQKIQHMSELENIKYRHEADLKYMEKRNALQTDLKRQMELRVNQQKRMIAALGPANLAKIASSSGRRDVDMLRTLNVQSTIITNGKAPINLLNTSSGLIGQSLRVF